MEVDEKMGQEQMEEEDRVMEVEEEIEVDWD